MKKKIIFITEALWIGGIETALLNLLNRMDYERYDVTLLVCRGELQLLDRVNSNCRVIIADREKTYTLAKPYRHTRLWHLLEEPQNPSLLHRAMMWTVPFLRYVENELYIRYIKEALQDESFDTAVLYNIKTAEIGIRSVRSERQLLFYHHGVIQKQYHDTIAYRKCAKIITVSEKLAAEMKRVKKQYADKVAVIHNLINIDEVLHRAGEQPETRFPAGCFHVVTCGRISHEKGIDRAVLACRQLIEKGYDDLHWWIVGGGPEEEAVRKMADDNGLNEHFHLLGMQANPYVYMKQADLYVQPSRYENYSVVLLEAMVLGLPIAATETAVDTQIIDGVNGRLCASDVQGIAKAAEEMYLHPEERVRYQDYLRTHSLEEENKKNIQRLYALL